MKQLKKRSLPILIVVAAFVVIFLTLWTDSGKGLVQGIQDRFPSTKELTQSIEENEERTNVKFHEGTNSDYVIYIDETRYQMSNNSDSTKITPVEPLPANYPEVFMDITHLPNEPPEQAVKQIQIDMENSFPESAPIPIETVTSPVHGYWLHGAAGSEWDSKIMDIYVLSDRKKGSYRITSNYFLEAAEGHGARFYYMLESFEVVQ